MAKPVAPYEWGFAARSASITTFTRHPADWMPEEAPTYKRGDGGQVKDGLDSLKLIWTTLKPAEWDQLMDMWNDAIAEAGLAKVRRWNELSSGGAGAWETVNCTVGTRPTARRGGRPSSPNYHDVEWVLEDLEIAS